MYKRHPVNFCYNKCASKIESEWIQEAVSTGKLPLDPAERFREYMVSAVSLVQASVYYDNNNTIFPSTFLWHTKKSIIISEHTTQLMYSRHLNYIQWLQV